MKAHLQPFHFDAKERVFLEHGDLTASLVKTDAGIAVVRIASPTTSLEILPFQGQQIWKAVIDGRDITMKSEVTDPVATTDYLRNYGAFLVHCGATAMGGPSPEDTHPLHGELPNAVYNNAWLETGTDESGRDFVEVHGNYHHQVAMTVSYTAHPVVRLTSGAETVHVSMTVQNMSRAPMDFMYLAHLNFAPVMGSRIVATHGWTPDDVHVRSSFPAHITVPEETQQLLKQLSDDPQRSAQIENDPTYDPEAVMMITYRADDEGYAHSLQVHPDGTSDYVRHEPKSAPNAIRCIQITPHHECVGLVLPSTAGVEGYLAEKEKGRVITLAPRQTHTVAFDFGSLSASRTEQIVEHIDAVMGLGQ